MRIGGFRASLVPLLALCVLSVCSCQGVKGRPDKINVPRKPGWRIAVMGDSREGVQILDRTVMLVGLLKPKPVMAIHLGDMIRNPGNEFEWAAFHDGMAPIELSMPLKVVAGNHDVDNSTSRDVFMKQFNFPGPNAYYRYDRNGVHMIFLDSEIEGEVDQIAGDQLAWLQDQMTQLAGDTAFKLVFCHCPFFRVAASTHDPIANGSEVHALFLAGGVQAVFTSHDHLYNHQVHDGIHYFISGGSGAPLEDGGGGEFNHFLLLSVSSDTLWVQVVNMAGDVVRTVAVTR